MDDMSRVTFLMYLNNIYYNMFCQKSIWHLIDALFWRFSIQRELLNSSTQKHVAHTNPHPSNIQTRIINFCIYNLDDTWFQLLNNILFTRFLYLNICNWVMSIYIYIYLAIHVYIRKTALFVLRYKITNNT